MWYEDGENQFVRAPAPSGFDKLVQNLEDRDSVIFESISIPKSNNNQPNPPQEHENQPEKEEDSLIETFDDEIEDDFIQEDGDQEENDITKLRERLTQLELQSSRKMELLKSKDQQIDILRKELTEARAKTSYEPKIVAQIPISTKESVEFYKSRFETTLSLLNSLKQSLKKDGKVKRVPISSARPITPRVTPQ